MRNTERGISHWPFIICLVLLLVFGFLWFSQKGEFEKKEKDLADTVKLKDQYASQLAESNGWLQKLTEVVGYVEKTPRKYQDGSQAGNFSDPEAIAKALNPDTPGGPIGALKDSLTVKMKSEIWRPKAGQPAAKTFDLEKLPADFKAKVKEVRDAWPGDPPAKPTDPDDTGAVASYTSAVADYEAKVKSYLKLMADLVAMKDFPAYAEVVGYYAPYELDNAKVLEWSFYWNLSPPSKLEDFMMQPATSAKLLRDAFVEVYNSSLQQVDAKEKQIAVLEKTIDNADENAPGLKQQLEGEQGRHSADNARLTKESSDAKADAETARVAATTATNEKTKLEGDTKVQLAKLGQTISAQENRIREEKERRELKIARNDPDGTLLDANAVLGVGYIDLGNQDKVYPGLKFEVSAIGRGGIRATKGEVMVTRVLDAHYSQVRIVSVVSASRPLGKGDLIANPLYDRSSAIHLYLAGELRKYPRAIAVERLARMGVIVEDKIHDKTDYVLIPDSLAVGAPASGEAKPEGGQESEFDRLQRLANTFGATLITESMIATFLDY